jgi:hypothetical protein
MFGYTAGASRAQACIGTPAATAGCFKTRVPTRAESTLLQPVCTNCSMHMRRVMCLVVAYGWRCENPVCDH